MFGFFIWNNKHLQFDIQLPRKDLLSYVDINRWVKNKTFFYLHITENRISEAMKAACVV